MSKRNPRRYEGNFALLPDEVLMSDAGRTLPHPAVTVLVALAAQFYGKNNGSLTLPRRSIKTGQSSAAKYGINNPYMLDRSFREFEARGLVLRTCPGSRLPPRAAMFALTWRPINEPKRDDPHDAKPTLSASNQWASWKAAKRERHWTVPESESRLDAKRREAEKRRTLRYPWATPASSPGIHGSTEISSPGIPARGQTPVAQGYSSDISGVGAGPRGNGRKKRAPVPPDAPASVSAVPRLPQAVDAHPSLGPESAQASPASALPPRVAVSQPAVAQPASDHAAQALPGASADEALSKSEITERWVRLLAADGSSTENSAIRTIRAVITCQGISFAAQVLLACEQRGLRGQAAREHLNEQRAVRNARIAEEHRQDRALALKIAKQLATGGGRRVADDDLDSWARTIRNMREDDGRTREEISLVFSRSVREERLRAKASNPVLLRHHWATLSESTART